MSVVTAAPIDRARWDRASLNRLVERTMIVSMFVVALMGVIAIAGGVRLGRTHGVASGVATARKGLPLSRSAVVIVHRTARSVTIDAVIDVGAPGATPVMRGYREGPTFGKALEVVVPSDAFTIVYDADASAPWIEAIREDGPPVASVDMDAASPLQAARCVLHVHDAGWVATLGG